MQNKLPKLFDKHKICVICEGNEEYEYLERLKTLKVWDAQYEIISDMPVVMEIFRRGIRTAIRMVPMN